MYRIRRANCSRNTSVEVSSFDGLGISKSGGVGDPDDWHVVEDDVLGASVAGVPEIVLIGASFEFVAPWHRGLSLEKSSGLMVVPTLFDVNAIYAARGGWGDMARGMGRWIE